jgi:hypothetical protein
MGDTINKIAWWLYRQPFNPPPCNSEVDLSNELESIDRVTCDVRQEGFSQYFCEEDINTIREYSLDFVLRFGFGIIRGDILEVPTYGVWSFHHGDEREYRGGPPCFWEIYNGDPCTGAVLQRLTDRLDGGIILTRGFFPTRRSYHENLNYVYYGTTEWPAQVAIDILNGNADYVDQSPTESDAPIYQAPSPPQIMLYNLKKWYSLGTNLLSGIGHWNIGVVRHSIEELIDENLKPNIDWYPFPKKDGFLADPFPMDIDGRTYIFVEEFSYQDWKGKISYIEYPDGFKRDSLKTAHEEPHHLSYPYLFKRNGDVYATPEIRESSQIRLYRVHSPSDWEFKTTLIEDTRGLDPTIIKYGS